MRPVDTPPNPPSVDEWRHADEFFASYLIPADPALEGALERSKKNGLPMFAVSAVQGKFLMLLVMSMRAKRVLEVGLLGGYSTIWLAKGLPDDGKVVSLEINEKFAEVAQQNISSASLSHKVEIKLGAAADTLKALSSDPSTQPFDLAFIDADNAGMRTYFAEAKKLVRKGGVIIIDNINRWASVSSPSSSPSPSTLSPSTPPTDKEGTQAIQNLLKDIKANSNSPSTKKEVDATALGMAGAKGFDGMLYAVKL